jgi:tRNA nucleotidyltransferase (CCA-adding enzyme)
MKADPGLSDANETDQRVEGLTVYQAGGSVRDRLLGLVPGDRDFVVVGAGPEELVRRGFRPVGRDFPVFLHPETGEEYALARTERKQGRGYQGFVFQTGPEVTLEQDLARRDLTINAMAVASDGQLVDPYNGRLDLQAGCLRHITDAFREDPVRVLRLARFATRFEEFEIAAKTLNLCRGMVENKEVSHLVPERVWQEMSRALMYLRPSRFFDVLHEIGALGIILPEIEAVFADQTQARYRFRALDVAAELNANLPVRFAVLVCGIKNAPAAIDELAKRLRVPGDCRKMACLLSDLRDDVVAVFERDASQVVQVLRRLDVFRKPDRLSDLLLACLAGERARGQTTNQPWTQAELWHKAAEAARSVDGGALHRSGLRGRDVAEAMQSEQIRRISAVLDEHRP